MGIGGGPGRIKFHGGDEAALQTLFDIVRIGLLCQIQGHQRLETITGRNGGQDAITISLCITRGNNRWNQVRHDDGTGKMTRRIADDAGQNAAVAQVKMPIVRTTDADRVHGLLFR